MRYYYKSVIGSKKDKLKSRIEQSAQNQTHIYL